MLDHDSVDLPVPLASRVAALMGDILSVEDQIQAACAHSYGHHTYDELVKGCIDGRYLFFKFDKCFCFCEVIKLPTGGVFHFTVAGGDLEEILHYKDDFIKYARASGCQALSMAGRKGWERVLAKDGWSHRFTTMAVEFD